MTLQLYIRAMLTSIVVICSLRNSKFDSVVFRESFAVVSLLESISSASGIGYSTIVFAYGLDQYSNVIVRIDVKSYA